MDVRDGTKVAGARFAIRQIQLPATFTRMDRRSFAFSIATGAAFAQERKFTAQTVIERIQKNVGVPWRAQTVDTFKAGDPQTAVTGIATTFMATYDVLQRAAAAGKNLVISHEPTFYNHEDQTKDFGD